MSVGATHRIAFTDWGPIGSGVPVICVPGLTRQRRDFDFLAAELARCGRRVLCPDLPGRGRSGRLLSPLQYILPQHCADTTAVCLATGAETIDWVGTSLGGLIGMVLAGLPGSRIRRLVINDSDRLFPLRQRLQLAKSSSICRRALRRSTRRWHFIALPFPSTANWTTPAGVISPGTASSEAHLRRILTSYARYYNETRTHLALDKDTPVSRPGQRTGAVRSLAILGGLHHRYARA